MLGLAGCYWGRLGGGGPATIGNTNEIDGHGRFQEKICPTLSQDLSMSASTGIHVYQSYLIIILFKYQALGPIMGIMNFWTRYSLYA